MYVYILTHSMIQACVNFISQDCCCTEEINANLSEMLQCVVFAMDLSGCIGFSTMIITHTHILRCVMTHAGSSRRYPQQVTFDFSYIAVTNSVGREWRKCHMVYTPTYPVQPHACTHASCQWILEHPQTWLPALV